MAIKVPHHMASPVDGVMPPLRHSWETEKIYRVQKRATVNSAQLQVLLINLNRSPFPHPWSQFSANIYARFGPGVRLYVASPLAVWDCIPL